MRARPIAFALLGLALVWAWLRFGVPLAALASDGHSDVTAEVLFTSVLYVPMLLVAIGLGLVAGAPLGWPSHLSGRAFAGGLMIGLTALALAISYCAIAGTLTRGSAAPVSAALLIGMAVIACQVLAEEALFRGYVQPLLVRGIGPVTGVLAAAAAFAVVHGIAGGADLITIGNMMLGGVLFGALALRGGGIAAAVGAHLGWNMAEQIGVGLDPNPGTGAFGALLDLDLAGAARWGGSEAGLNASWAMSFALVAAVIVAAWWPRADAVHAIKLRAA